jgi:hypothetical protein
VKRDDVQEARLTQVNGRLENFVRYSLEMEQPGSDEPAIETFSSMPAVVARATSLIQAGYRIGISSSPAKFKNSDY